MIFLEYFIFKSSDVHSFEHVLSKNGVIYFSDLHSFALLKLK